MYIHFNVHKRKGSILHFRYLGMFQGYFKFAGRKMKVKIKIGICKLRAEAKMHELP